MIVRSYSELRRISEFEERFRYLSLHGQVGRATFGYDRYLNQKFYTSPEWRRIRNHVIARDLGCDLAIEGHEIYDKIVIHHMNPVTHDDLVHGNEEILDPKFLITTTHRTHNAIHYGDEGLLSGPMVQRMPGDTMLW